MCRRTPHTPTHPTQVRETQTPDTTVQNSPWGQAFFFRQVIT